MGERLSAGMLVGKSVFGEERLLPHVEHDEPADLLLAQPLFPIQFPERFIRCLKGIRAVVAVLRADGEIDGRARRGERGQVAVPLRTRDETRRVQLGRMPSTSEAVSPPPDMPCR